MAKWTDEELLEMGEKIDEGWTASRTARYLHRHRNSAIGAAFRQGWHFGQVRATKTLVRRPPNPFTNRAPHERTMSKVCCSFGPEVFEEIKALADEEGCSIPAKIRDLVEWGLGSIQKEGEGR